VTRGRVVSTRVSGLVLGLAAPRTKASEASAVRRKPPRYIHVEESWATAYTSPMPASPSHPTGPNHAPPESVRPDPARPDPAPRHQPRRVNTTAPTAPTSKGLEARVGAVVDPARIDARPIQGGHQPGRGHGERAEQHGQAPAPPAEAQKHHQEQRPDHIELLLDRQAPHVQQRRRGGVLLKVGDPLDHEPPVGRIEQRGDQVAAQPRPDHRGGEQHAYRQTKTSTAKSAGSRRRAR
jgi:hypothetical protein